MPAMTERKEREERAKRLVRARKRAELRGPKHVAEKFGFNENTYKAHEQGRNGFGISDARAYARAFNVSLPWLNFGIGSIDDPYLDASLERQEYIELLEALPPDELAVELASLRNLVRALSGRSDDESEPAKGRSEDILPPRKLPRDPP